VGLYARRASGSPELQGNLRRGKLLSHVLELGDIVRRPTLESGIRHTRYSSYTLSQFNNSGKIGKVPESASSKPAQNGGFPFVSSSGVLAGAENTNLDQPQSQLLAVGPFVLQRKRWLGLR
jgi:hypothetical protein